MPLKGPTYKKGEKVTYTSFGKSCEALILGAHLDDELMHDYTIELPDGRQKQTDDAHLSPLIQIPSHVIPPPVPIYQPPAPMPKQPPQFPSVSRNQPVTQKEEYLPKPQDRRWVMTGRHASPLQKKKEHPPKIEDKRTLNPQEKQSHDYPRDENPQYSLKPSTKKLKSMKAKKRRQHVGAPQQPSHHRQPRAPQVDSYSRHYQQMQDPWRRQDPFGSSSVEPTNNNYQIFQIDLMIVEGSTLHSYWFLFLTPLVHFSHMHHGKCMSE